MANLKNMDNVVEKWGLLQHPFYRAWTDGSLPLDALKLYARDYGEFIAALPEGWRGIGNEDWAQEEVDHIALWEEFADTMDTKIGHSEIPQMKSLMQTCSKLFAERATSLGAMYAFERQQPATAESKLDGLRKHFAQLESEHAEHYFKVHAEQGNAEYSLIGSMIAELDEEGRQRAMAACEEMCEALWHSLSGIVEASGLEMNCDLPMA